MAANNAIFNNTSNLMNLITSVNTKVDSIINGTSNVTISYDLDAIRPGDGISVDRRTPNRLKVINTNQQYNISNTSITEIFTNNIITLSTFNNYIVHKNAGTPIILNKDLHVFIADAPIRWKKGQTLRLVFDDELVTNTFNLKLYTDASNIANLGAYGVLIGSVSDDEFLTSDNKPIFDIICLDETLLTFRIDKIR